MSSLQKIAVSLLFTILVSAVFFATALTDVCSFLETKFYQPAVISSYLKKTAEDASLLDSYLKSEKERFSEYALNSFVESFLQKTPSDIDTQMRTKVTGDLFMSTTGLLGLRFIDANARYVHFSSFSNDIISKTERSVEYKNYGDISGEIAFARISPEDTGIAPRTIEELSERVKIVFDSSNENSSRIIFSVPYYDSLSVFRGFLSFYVSAQDFPRYLVSLGKSSIDTQTALINCRDEKETAGFLFNLPPLSSDANKALRILLSKGAGEKWKNSAEDVSILNESENGENWALFTSTSLSGEKIGWLLKTSAFAVSQNLRIFFYACAVSVLFLTFFLLCCIFFRDKMQTVRKRIRRFQFKIIADYLEKKESVDWQTIADSIQISKTQFSAQIKESLGHTGKKKEKEIDALLERSWSDILGVLGAKEQKRGGTSFSLEQLKKMLEEVLSNHRPSVQVVSASERTTEALPESKIKEDAGEIEEIEEIEEADEIEEIEDAEAIEEIEEAQSVDEIEDVEEIGDAEEIEEVEELEEIGDPNEELPEHLRPKPQEEFKAVPLSQDIGRIEKLLHDGNAESSEEISKTQEIEVAEEVPAEVEEAAESVIEDTSDSEDDDEIVTSEFEDEFDEVTADAREEEKREDEKRSEEAEWDSTQFVYEKPDFSFLDSNAESDENDEDDDDSEAEIEIVENESTSFSLFKNVLECEGELFGEDESENEKSVIVEKDGVFVVAPDLETGIEKNQGLAELVDSVSHIGGTK